jgi:hypothetical protein
MLEYKIESSCYGYTGSYLEIHVLFNSVIVGCIYYIEDSLRSSKPDVSFDKWRKYEQYKNQIPKIDALKVAQEAILEHYLLTDSI